jgi:hypothetical protein
MSRIIPLVPVIDPVIQCSPSNIPMTCRIRPHFLLSRNADHAIGRLPQDVTHRPSLNIRLFVQDERQAFEDVLPDNLLGHSKVTFNFLNAVNSSQKKSGLTIDVYDFASPRGSRVRQSGASVWHGERAKASKSACWLNTLAQSRSKTASISHPLSFAPSLTSAAGWGDRMVHCRSSSGALFNGGSARHTRSNFAPVNR